MTSFNYTITSELGLHARPATMMVKRLIAEPCEVTVTCGTRKANAAHLFALMEMAVKCGETVTVSVNGEGEAAVCKELEEFFKANY